MQRNRPYNQHPDRDDQNRFQQPGQYRSSGQYYPEHEQFPDDRYHHYPRQESRQPEYRQQGRPPYEQERSRLDPSEYRGAYRLDTSGEHRRDYRHLNEENFGAEHGYGHPGHSRSGGDRGRHQSDYGTGATYGASRNAGSMGSYGGAQGFGSGRNGYHEEDERWASGRAGKMPEAQHRVYGAYRDKNSFAPGENESYDGSQRYGSQGADNTRGWISSGRSGSSGPYRHATSPDDARYEIYDTSQSQFNRGEYNNTTQGNISDELNLRSHQNYPPYQAYGSLQRGHNRQGTGSDQDNFIGGTDMDSNTAGSLSVGYDGFRGEARPRNRYYDPLTGDMRNPQY